MLKTMIKRIPGSEELYYLVSTLPHRFDPRQVPSLPLSVMIELNNTCNLHCQMCGTTSARRIKGMMDFI